jgi:hypothetical protein
MRSLADAARAARHMAVLDEATVELTVLELQGPA